MTGRIAHYPSETPITAYGNGGFRFADMSHKGSILCLPSGIFAWQVSDPNQLTAHDLAFVIESLSAPTVLLLGTGATQVWPDEALSRAFLDANLGLEVMSTGAAARTYNVLLAEKRRVAAALIAVP
ncbi:MAG: hypothetical protein CTY31_13050 [Hyphomicrobium sp.]|nr:MAG: hypothetical protein CTY39_10270 [Hyphomicrobium sp.]PPC98497.1 MAG: hypothetical protein CTY31_13050 [Hyphomicrobium sp.]